MILRSIALAAAAAAIAGCWDDTRPIAWDRDRTVLGPIPLKTEVAYVDSALDRVTLLDLSADRPAIRAVPIGRRALYAVPGPDQRTLFVITRGEEAIHRGEIDQPPQLWLVSSEPGVAPISYAIASPYDRLAISPDGTRAVAYFSATGPDSEGFFRNPNEIAIVDLTSPPGADNPVDKTIRSFGSVPDGIELSPSMVVPGASDARTFAFVLSDNNLTVLDASHPTRSEITIRLDLGGAPVTPREIVFAPNTASAYVRSDNARDVLQVLLVPDIPTGADANDYRPQLAELGAGGGPTDIAVYDDVGGKRYLVASTPNTGEVVVIDADTAQFRSIPVPDPIDRVLLFPSGGATPPTVALLASLGARLPRVWMLGLEHVQDPLTSIELDRIDLDQGVRDVVPVPDRALAMLVHDDARTVLGLLDLATRSTSPLLGVGELDSYAFSPDGSHLIGATDGVSRIGFVQLDDLHPSDFRLDDPPAKVIATTNFKVFVDHGDPLGRATIIPSPDATRAEATVLAGFLTANLLDQEP
jgi:hypothetical protein